MARKMSVPMLILVLLVCGSPNARNETHAIALPSGKKLSAPEVIALHVSRLEQHIRAGNADEICAMLSKDLRGLSGGSRDEAYSALRMCLASPSEQDLIDIEVRRVTMRGNHAEVSYEAKVAAMDTQGTLEIVEVVTGCLTLADDGDCWRIMDCDDLLDLLCCALLQEADNMVHGWVDIVRLKQGGLQSVAGGESE